MTAVEERTVLANGLRHHVVLWTPSEASSGATLVATHGFLDLAWSWRWVAERLAARGRRVVAFDWRGHGESEWVGAGGYYYFADYVADLADLVDALVPGELHLVGHSMGGSAALLYAGTFPDRVSRLVLMEGLGPPEPVPEPPPARLGRWLASVREARARRAAPSEMASVDAALERMRRANPHVPAEVGRELAERSTRELPGAAGRTWVWDPLHRTPGPYPFRAEDFLGFARAVTAPTLLLDADRGFALAPEDHARRVAALRDCRSRTIAGSGHMMHWEAPGAVAEAIDAFLGGAE